MEDSYDHQTTVCCMCGDVGFPDKLFYCTRCRWRSQHSYCSNYYHGESSSDLSTEQVCDWCQQSEEASRRTSTNFKRGAGSSSSKKLAMAAAAPVISAVPRSEYSNERIKLHHHHDKEESGGDKGKSSGSGAAGAGFPSPRTATRRYKLLKDVMC